MVGGALQLGLTILAARLLGPEQNGHYAQFVLVFNLVFIGLNFGLGPASTYFVASGRLTEAAARRISVRVISLITALLGLVTLLIWKASMIRVVESAFKIPVPLFLWGLAGGVLLLTFNQMLAIMMGGHRYDTVNLLNISKAGVPLLFIALLSLLVAPDSLNLSIAHTAAMAVVLMLSIMALTGASEKNRSAELMSEKSVGSVLHAMLGYGALVYASNLLHYLAMRGLLLLLSYYSIPESVGFLNLALLLLEVTLLLPSAIGQLVFPQSSTTGFDRRVIEIVLRINMLIGLFLAVGVVLLSIPVIRVLMGEAYVSVGSAMMHLAPSVILLAIPRILSQVLSGQGYPRYPLIAAALSLVVGAILAVLLIPRWGVLGAVWAINAVSAITATVTLVGYSRVHKVAMCELLKPRFQDWAGVQRMLAKISRS
ncbi:lipopolysaccharide biosynthesis protein [Comamonas guangdongensis]|uniref:Lipopolysaccharide biosynthesis protein n=1 Tax=Comamonas guangdongensis TaxID=510515 RepID=A0ABV3ZSN9_9BURK